jgi:Tol biopolymer transport system component
MSSRTSFSRSLLGTAVAAAVIALGPIPAVDSQSPPGPELVTLTEGTNITATVSPDGQDIIMDLQGVLWHLPASGGAATRLTRDLLEPARPDWSPQGDLVAFQAYAGGTFHIWTMRPDGSDLRQLTDGHGDHRDPRMSPDGTLIAFASDRAFEGSYDIWTMDTAGGGLARVTTDNTLEEFEPAWSPDGESLAFVSGTSSSGVRIEVLDGTGTRTTFVEAPPGARLNSPAWAPNGEDIAYVQTAGITSHLMVSGARVGTNDDVFPFPAAWLSAEQLLYTADGGIQVAALGGGDATEIPFEAEIELNRPAYQRKAFDFDTPRRQPVQGIVGPALAPDGERIVFQALNDIWLMDQGQRPRRLTDDDYYESDPAWSPDGTRIVYSSDKAGTPDLYILDLGTFSEQRLTGLEGAEVSAAWSPDGSQIAFQDHTGATHTVEVATGSVRQVLLSLFAPGKPSWAANGHTIAIAALKPYSRRFREGTSQIVTVSVLSGEVSYWEPAPFESLSTRGEDGPVFSPDGTALAFVMQSTLWVMPVDGSGHPAGPAEQITTEATDAPTWSGDSQRLLYLSNGELRLVSRDGGAPSSVPVHLGWKQERPIGRKVIHAGRFWDGTGQTVLDDVDIVVVRNRIVSVGPHRDRPRRPRENDQFIDASQYTVMPGLWESHTHEWISGKNFGARLGRLWLAYGVTSLQSVGDPAYRAVETRESYASGARVGPRFFATGEAVDGERIFYNFMRPTTGGDEQLARELSRAEGLDYDMVKTYVRLAHEDQAKVVDFAHGEMGVWTASHYMLPGMAFGMDGQTHISATTRLGYAYTRSSAGISYSDVTDLFARSGMFVISTTFNPTLYAEDPAMVDDPRLVTLNPSWEQAALRAKRDAAVSTDQTLNLARLEREEDTVRRILRDGGVVLAGTDSPLDNPATALHLNLRGQVKFGLAPWEALQTATLLPAQQFGLADDLGTLEPGKLADLVLVDGDPLNEIADADNVRAVMKNGRLYTIDELVDPYVFPVEANAPAAKASARPARASAPAASGRDYWWHDPSLWQGEEAHAH